jgi:hypothetical protein
MMQEASQKHFESGSTATVVLIADGQIIAANVGDSKAFLCSEGHDPHRRNSYVSCLCCSKLKHISPVGHWFNLVHGSCLFLWLSFLPSLLFHLLMSYLLKPILSVILHP